jgi:hypothetical protein
VRWRALLGLPGAVVAVWLAGLSACGPPEEDARTRFAFDTPVVGEVLQNSRACTVDAYCTLRISFVDTVVGVIYGSGERPAPACRVPVPASDTAFSVGPGALIRVEVEDCGLDGAYLHAIERRRP